MNIRESKQCMNIHCTAGMTATNLVADLPGYGTMWFHLKGITNILSLARVKEQYKVTYDSDHGNAFLVHNNDGMVCCFMQSPDGL